jgi:hypothetical protein
MYIECSLISHASIHTETVIAFIIDPGSYKSDIAQFLYTSDQNQFLYLYLTNEIFHNSSLVDFFKKISLLS